MIPEVHRRAAAQLLCLLAVLALPQCLFADETPWWVSLGVYRGEAAAQRALDALPADAVPAGSQVKIVQIEQRGTTYHRLVAGPFASRASVDNALPAWRVKVQGAFPLMLAADDESAAQAVVDMAARAAIGDAGAQGDAVEPEAVSIVDAVMPPVGAQSEAQFETRADGASNSVEVSVQETPAVSQDGDARRALGGLGLDTGTERLLRDDRALQRELERLSRGLPKGLSAEIDAARAEGVSLRELKLRSPSGPQSPTGVPDGYQLHRLHRDPSPADATLNAPAHSPAGSDWWSFPHCAT